MEGDAVRDAISRMIDKMLDDSNFESLEDAQQMVARGETVQKLATAELEARRLEVERDRVVVQAIEAAGRFGIDADRLGLPKLELKG